MNRIKSSKVIEDIRNLQNSLEKENKRYFPINGSNNWNDDWPKHGKGIPYTGGQKNASVYILWDEKEAERPVYVGETGRELGYRLWKHDRPENTWTKAWKYVQYISDPKLDDGEFRLLFESFLIYVLDPIDNNPKRKNERKNQ